MKITKKIIGYVYEYKCETCGLTTIHEAMINSHNCEHFIKLNKEEKKKIQNTKKVK